MPLDDEILQTALIGFRHRLEEIDGEIAELRRRLGKKYIASSNSEKSGRSRMSAAGRKRIALAQKRRWREWRRSREG